MSKLDCNTFAIRKNSSFTYYRRINWRGARVVDRGSLLRSCTFTGTGGSNPFLSAINKKLYFLLVDVKVFYFCIPNFSGYSVARLSRLLWEQEVAGSNPATPTLFSTKIDDFWSNALITKPKNIKF